MIIEQLELLAPDLRRLRACYADRLGLAVLADAPDRLTFQVGTSHLTFVQAPAQWHGRYHFAFNIPEQDFADAKAWLAARVPLIADETGEDEFFSTSWNAHICYFYDPAGNIGELIARHTLPSPNAAPQLFGAQSLLAVSEIGVAANDVTTTVAQLTTQLNITPYGTPSDSFAPLGTEEGLLIVVPTGRIWFPNTGVPAAPLPFTATLRTATGTTRRLVATPTGLTVEAAASQ